MLFAGMLNLQCKWLVVVVGIECSQYAIEQWGGSRSF